MPQSRDTMPLVSDSYPGEKSTLKQFWVDMYAESEPLLVEKIEVKLLRSADVKTATNTVVRSIANDPLYIYRRDAPDVRNPKRFLLVEKLRYRIGLHRWVRKRMAFTVDKGHAIVCVTPPQAVDNPSPSKIDRYFDALIGRVVGLIRHLSETKEQRKRMEEINTKVVGIVAELLGDAAKEMRIVDSLGTDPDFQGRGYGGALVDYITSLADAEGRATYLLSSNPINTGFYNLHGFVEIGKVFIGEGNPTWKGPPLPVLLMVRPLAHNASQQVYVS